MRLDTRAVSLLSLATAAIVLARGAAAAAPPSAPPGDVAILVDVSSSMRGFIGKDSNAIQEMVEDLSIAAGLKDSTWVSWGAVGPEVEWDAAERLSRSDAYVRSRCDLSRALHHPRAEAADLMILVTDGQPTPKDPRNTDCAHQNTPDLGELADIVIERAAAGHRAWLLLEHLPFTGTFYLNCSKPTAAVRSLQASRRIRCERECSYPHDGKRTLAVLVLATPRAALHAQAMIESILERRPQAQAVELSQASNAWQLKEVAVREVRVNGSEDIPVLAADGECRKVEIKCGRDYGVEVCVTAQPPSDDRSRVEWLVGFEDPIDILRPEPGTLVARRPADRGFAHELLPRIRARQYDECSRVWEVLKDIEAERPTIEPTCGGGDGDRVLSMLALCGCLPADVSKQSVRLTQRLVVRTGPILDHLAPFIADAHRRFDQPERIYGLDTFLRKVGAYWADRAERQERDVMCLDLSLRRDDGSGRTTRATREWNVAGIE